MTGYMHTVKNLMILVMRLKIKNYYPARIVGFVTINYATEAVVHCSEKPVNWTDVEDNFIVRTKLGSSAEISIVSVPISSLVHPLCALPDYGSGNRSYIIVLPKRNWSWFFEMHLAASCAFTISGRLEVASPMTASA